jgi:hypothetical protein
MSDGISIKFNMSGVTRELATVNRDMDRATMYGLRRLGASVRKEARSKAGEHDYSGPERVGVIKGELRKSIKTSRNIKNDGVYRTLTVGPTGKVRRDGGGAYGVPLYRVQQEAKYGYMAGGYAAAVGSAAATLEKAWAKSLKRSRG